MILVCRCNDREDEKKKKQNVGEFVRVLAQQRHRFRLSTTSATELIFATQQLGAREVCMSIMYIIPPLFRK